MTLPTSPNRPAPIDIFIAYSHHDDELRSKLVVHLAGLQRQGKIAAWFDQDIEAGSEWEAQLKARLESSPVILLLISANFLASDYCYEIEMTRAIERHQANTALVIPIILRPCDWKNSPFSTLQVLPNNAMPVTSWRDQDLAFLDVAQGIRKTVDFLHQQVQKESLISNTKHTIQETRKEIPMPGDIDKKNHNINNTVTEKMSILNELLRLNKWQEADQETSDLLSILARGEGGGSVVRVKDIARISCDDLKLVDEAWRKYSKNKFGFTIQSNIWHSEFSCKYDLQTEINMGNRLLWRTEIGWKRDNELTFDLEEACDGHFPAFMLSSAYWRSEPILLSLLHKFTERK